jgi:methyltransferase OMS1
MKDLLRERWIYLFGSGAALVCLSYFTASLTMYWRQEPAPCYPLGCEPDPPTGRPSIQSPYEFDLHLDKSEHRFGITKLRRKLGTAVRGHVLEVAIGTGRNLEFYNWDTVTDSLLRPEERAKAGSKSSSSVWMPSLGGSKEKEDEPAVLSFTGVDISPGMLDIALRRMRQVVPHMAGQIPRKPSFAILAAQQRDDGKPQGGHVVSFLSDRIRLLQGDAQSALPAPPTLPSESNPSSLSTSTTPQKYDTILQTFGLCSVRDPVSLLSLMASSLQPNTGRILLIEHGRSVWDLVNGLLDRGARGHHERFGCWWNRDIEVIVSEAARRVPGLEVLRLERPGWTTAGTHVVVELRVRDSDAKNEKQAKEQKSTGWASIFPSLLSTRVMDDSKKE